MKICVCVVAYILIAQSAHAKYEMPGNDPFSDGYCSGQGVSLTASCSDKKTETACESASSWVNSHPCTWTARPLASAKYQSSSAKDKLDTLWAKITENSAPGPWASGAGQAAKILSEDMKTTFAAASDSVPLGHKKVIHSQGVISQLEWVSSGDHKYTGVLASGSNNSIIRFHSASQPDYTQSYTPPLTTGTFAPGISVKVLRDGIPSANFVCLGPHGADGQNSFNYFAQKQTTHVNAKFNPVLADKFATASSWITMVGLKDFCAADLSGAAVAKPVFPWVLDFEPTAAVKSLFSDAYSGKPFADQLTTLPAGTVLFDVMAKEDPKADALKIGELKIITSPIKSTFADEAMFFQHRKMEFDFEDHPEWVGMQDVKPVKPKFFNHFNEESAASGCPMGTMLNELSEHEKMHSEKDTEIARLRALLKKQDQRQIQSAASGCPFGQRMLHEHRNKQAKLSSKLEESLAQCSQGVQADEQWLEQISA